MRIPSGKTDQLIYFVALDSTDNLTRKTGLSSFTVYRSRNGGAATAYTTPTVAELSSANMPGVYALTVDEDTTIASGSDSEEYCVHITATGMSPVTRTIELYRRGVTSGQTAAVDSSGAVTAGTVSDKTGYALTAAYDAAKTAAQAGNAMTLSGDFTATMKTSLNAATPAVTVSDKTGFSLSASGLAAVTAWTVAITGNITGDLSGSVGSVTGLTVSNLDIAVSTRLAEASYTAPDNAGIAAIQAKTDNLPSDPADQSLVIAATTAIYDRIGAPAGLSVSADIAAVKAVDDAVKAKTDNLPASPAATGDAMTLTAAYDAAKTAATQTSVDDLPTNAELAAALASADDATLAAIAALPTAATVDAIKATTDSLTFTVPGKVDANIKAVNDADVTGAGTSGAPWGPA